MPFEKEFDQFTNSDFLEAIKDLEEILKEKERALSTKNKEPETLSDRMKSYENRYKVLLDYGKPKIVRLDLRAGKTFTKNFDKPFDQFFSNCMVETMKALCSQIPGARLGYTQSDEITILIKDINKENQEIGFFNNSLTKITSITASLCTSIFNKLWAEGVAGLPENSEKFNIYKKRLFAAVFDCRFFELPDEQEILNNFIWRQSDCYVNAVNATARSIFSEKELNGKSVEEKLAMLSSAGVNFSSLSLKFSRGVICLKTPKYINDVERFKWEESIAPNFKSNLSFIKGVYNGNNLFV